MYKTITIIGTKNLWAMIATTVLAAFTPTVGFLTAIIIGWGANVWCGMRADGVTLFSCHNFSWKKFLVALAELLMYLSVMEVVSLIGHQMGDDEEVRYACKTMSYFIIYCYGVNSLRNLCKVYPNSEALWLIYVFVRMDFRRLWRIDDLMERYKEHKIKEQEYADNNITT
ncbi:MAG: hypothetical protein IJ897_04805 [Prevotella sp.]|nr:hypothetical protein [Prevotella sp.]MBR4645359.1 hypothetical protein [Bacteroidaceae bacterium]